MPCVMSSNRTRGMRFRREFDDALDPLTGWRSHFDGARDCLSSAFQDGPPGSHDDSPADSVLFNAQEVYSGMENDAEFSRYITSCFESEFLDGYPPVPALRPLEFSSKALGMFLDHYKYCFPKVSNMALHTLVTFPSILTTR